MSKGAAIITRSYNRLEYTIRTMNSVVENTKYPDYKHVIVDNGSNDGTRQWLKWIKEGEGNWFNNVDFEFAPNNLGDWGGMIYGAKKYAKDYKYIVQLDNDISVPEGWLSAMIETLEAKNVDAVMLRRTGVKNHIKTTDSHALKLSDGKEVTVGKIPFVVACYVTRSDFFLSVCDKVERCRDFGKFLNKSCMKIETMDCNHMEGWNGVDFPQQQKYPISERTWQKFS
jgi:glycosyltransferase involved in cell wall biosynthesis